MKFLINGLIAILAIAGAPAMAQKFPTKPVRLIIAFPSGSATDIVGRIYTQKLTEMWGQNVIADNRGGAGGSIAGAIAAKATPDGYTFLMHSSGQVINPSLYAKLPFDTNKDFIDVAPVAQQPNVLVVNPASSIKSAADLISRAKAKPGSINFASAGIGSGTHLNLEKLMLAAKVNVTHIPYKGSGEALIDVIGGRVDAFMAPISAGMGHIKSGKVRAVAVSTAKRSSVLPDVPTIAESGVPGFDFSLWFGIWAPRGVPDAIVNKVAADVARTGDSSDVREKLASLGSEPMKMTRAEFTKFARGEMTEYAKIIKAAGIKPL